MTQLLHRWSAAALLQALVWGVVMSLSLGLPVLLYGLELRYQEGTLSSETQALAFVISQRVTANPQMWMYETPRLESSLRQRKTEAMAHERRTVLDADGAVLVELGPAQQLAAPLAEHREPLYEQGRVVGWVVLQRSLHPQMLQSIALGTVTVLGGAALALALTGLPLRRLRAAEDELAHKAFHDDLTGLYNRDAFRRVLAESVTLAAREQRTLAVMFIDLDRFKSINDSLGHDAGDEALRGAADRLRASVRATDVVARLSGDEFALLLEGGPQLDSAAWADTVLQRFEAPFVVAGRPWQLGCSVGVALFPAHARDADRLLACADTAMLHAKSGGRGSARLYDATMEEAAAQHARVERDLRGALERGEFELYYQPQVRLADGRVCSAEALLRWHHPQRGLVAPGEFIAVLEASGLIHPVGRWVLHEACRQMRAWLDGGLPLQLVAVNVSALQFDRGAEFIDAVRGALAESGLPARHLQLELTESTLMADSQQSLVVLRELRALGVGLAIDDFGTGYSSLAYLCSFPVTVLKVDRSFVRDMMDSGPNANIVEAVVRMAHGLKLSVTAEGIETEGQRAALQALGCDTGQGYGLGRPVPAAEFARTLLETSAPEAAI